MPQESDDPNSTIALILDYLREIDISVEFPPNKLKQGSGEHAVYVLDNLADNALKVENFKWKRYGNWRFYRNFYWVKLLNYNNIRVNILPDEPTPEADIEDDEAELILEKVEEEMMAEYDDDDQDILHIDDITKLYGQNIVGQNFILREEYCK